MSDVFFLTLGTPITPREAELMIYGMMGSLFKHRNVRLDDGNFLMLFDDVRVQRRGIKRIETLRKVIPEGCCASCGKLAKKYYEVMDDPYCKACRNEYRLEEAESDAFDAAFKKLIKRHLRKWQRGRPLEDVLGRDGCHVKGSMHHILLDMLKADFEREAC